MYVYARVFNCVYLRKFFVVGPFSHLNLLIFSKTSRSTFVWTDEPVSPQRLWFIVMPLGYPSVDNGNFKNLICLHLRLFKDGDDYKKKAIKLVVKGNNLFLLGQCGTGETILMIPLCLQIVCFLVNLIMSAVRMHPAFYMFYPGTIFRRFKRVICPENVDFLLKIKDYSTI